MTAHYDVVIVGGGPAGLSAALVLGRAVRRVLLVDDGRYRNGRAQRVNGFLTRDGTPPSELRAIGREQLARYDVTVVDKRVVAVSRLDLRPGHLLGGDASRFHVVLEDDSDVTAQAMILATGVVDVLPDIPGLLECFGVTIHHCPYCDGFEHRGRRLAVHGVGGEQLARTLKAWSPHVTLFAEGGAGDVAGVEVVRTPVAAFQHVNGVLMGVRLATGQLNFVDAVFLKLSQGQRQRSRLAEALGVRVRPDGSLEHDGHGGTAVPGLFIAGDATRDLLLSITAAAEGAEVAVMANHYLLDAGGP